MTDPAPTTRARLLTAAHAQFYKHGFARVSVDAIAAEAGVTKRTLYYHFESKDALAAAIIAAQDDLARARLAGWELDETGDPAAMIDALFAEMEDWASRPGWAGAGFSRLAVELADLPGHPARAAASAHKRFFENWLAERLDGMGVVHSRRLARDALILLEGGGALALFHQDSAYIRHAAAAARRLISDVI